MQLNLGILKGLISLTAQDPYFQRFPRITTGGKIEELTTAISARTWVIVCRRESEPNVKTARALTRAALEPSSVEHHIKTHDRANGGKLCSIIQSHSSPTQPPARHFMPLSNKIRLGAHLINSSPES